MITRMCCVVAVVQAHLLSDANASNDVELLGFGYAHGKKVGAPGLVGDAGGEAGFSAGVRRRTLGAE